MSKTFIEIKNLKKYFNVKDGKKLHAVDDVSFNVDKGEIVGLVGESGCGKSTTGRVILRLLEATAGNVFLEGEDIIQANKNRLKQLRRRMQIVFQDPNSSLNPRKSVRQIISEPLIVQGILKSKEMQEKVYTLMEETGVAFDLVGKYPHELDGGVRQRVGIARALALGPEFIVCDEPVSALDVSIQAQMLNLFQDLKEKKDLTYLFISHDLSVVRHISDRILVMYVGRLVEEAEADDLFINPMHPYTKALLSAIPVPKIRKESNRILLKGDVPSPIDPPPGCRFAKRCWMAKEECFEKEPELKEYSPGHRAACHFVE
ncbi:MAG TPA: ATP-binding cassette domain-containing protein [Bacillota bacterium]|nr:ATP-binding cassette domain-containing protein [Clostridiaceae bacterium]HNR03221.1 ATP-binding cassette domain-containing protein [Bacillota bacterium]HNT02978.1 ATP-binding cassette domain-containing protein [Bacillota bacterium]HPA54098.1 ATP-binding cassette domain-containing protein [Bacillota bacterium]HPX67784.1 ATP-binding cassette domain-containing protein [Bacillota bacterium]